MIEKQWEILHQNLDDVENLMRSCAVGKLPALVLTNRGIKSDQVKDLLEIDEKVLHNPLLLPQMEEAVSFIEESIKHNKRICIFGDYDCDGITATVMVYEYLCSIGADVFFSLPKREKDGYGLSYSVIDELKEQGTEVLLTVDNGISSVSEIAYANSLGIKTVVTDHHTCGEVLPPAVAVINPHRKDSKYPFSELCGCGVAFKLISAMDSSNGESLFEEYGDILTIATIADMVPLVDENRYFVKEGLELLRNTNRIGLSYLMEKCGINLEDFRSDAISFGIAPRINAAGRVADAKAAAMMLLEEDPQKAREIVEEICRYNEQRKTSETEAVAVINDILNNDRSYLADRVMVVSGTGWNQGVSGIVCSRLSDRFKKPCIVINIDGDIARGSGRSIEGFSLIDAINACSEYLVHYGGHPLAAGITLDSSKIQDFRKAILEYAEKNYNCMPIKKLTIDSIVEPELLNIEEIEKLSVLEPFGIGNEMPTFAVKSCHIDNIIALSEGKHTKLRLSKNGYTFFALCFSTNFETFPYQKDDEVDIAFSTEISEFMGERSASLKLKGIRPANTDSKKVFDSALEYEQFLRGENKSASLRPTRDDAAIIYKGMLKTPNIAFEVMDLYRRLKLENIMSYAKYHIAIDALAQLEIIDNREGKLFVKPNPKKSDFESAPLLKKFNA